MVDVETKTKRETPPDAPAAVWTPEPAPREPPGAVCEFFLSCSRRCAILDHFAIG